LQRVSQRINTQLVATKVPQKRNRLSRRL